MIELQLIRMNRNPSIINFNLYLILILVSACVDSTYDYPRIIIKEKHWERRYDSAMWMFYKTNYFHKRLYCSNICETLKDSIIDDTNLSYLPAQIQMLKLIGDTLEFYIATTLEDTCYICIPITNEPIINIFGFYPNSDTVTYFAMDGMKYNRKPQNIDHSANQKKDFENHIKNNSKSLNY